MLSLLSACVISVRDAYLFELFIVLFVLQYGQLLFADEDGMLVHPGFLVLSDAQVHQVGQLAVVAAEAWVFTDPLKRGKHMRGQMKWTRDRRGKDKQPRSMPKKMSTRTHATELDA